VLPDGPCVTFRMSGPAISSWPIVAQRLSVVSLGYSRVLRMPGSKLHRAGLVDDQRPVGPRESSRPVSNASRAQ